MGLEISRISTNYDSNIICIHRNALLPDEGKNSFSRTDLDTSSKPDLDITQCARYLFNEPLHLNINTQSYNLVCKYYVTPTIIPKDTLPNNRRMIQPGGISRKDSNILE